MTDDKEEKPKPAKKNLNGKGKLYKYIPNDADRKLVIAMASVGCTIPMIADAVGVATDTIERHYKADYKPAKAKMIHKVAHTLAGKALKGDNYCIGMFLRTQGQGAFSEENNITIDARQCVIGAVPLTEEEFKKKYIDKEEEQEGEIVEATNDEPEDDDSIPEYGFGLVASTKAKNTD